MSLIRRQDRSPIVAILFIQALVYGGLYLLSPYLEALLGYTIPLFWGMLAQGVFAGLITALCGFSRWWIVGQAALPPLAVLALAANIPVWVFPVILILLVLIFWNVATNRVPLYLTNKETAAALLDMCPKTSGLHFADLGSGLGGTLRFLARHLPDARFTGLETAPLPFAATYLFGKFGGPRNLSFRFQDIWKQDLAEFDIVYCFLSPVPMARLFEKAKNELKPGSLFISNSFAIPEHEPDEVVLLEDRRKTRLLVWKM
ncbi:MAG: trans-aconitate methyltransferase [Sneathiella sp.]|nr:MAG: trans-aconitate methyltransferase [Sneathiella sp.]